MKLLPRAHPGKYFQTNGYKNAEGKIVVRLKKEAKSLRIHFGKIYL